MQRFTVTRKVKDPKNKIIMGGREGYGIVDYFIVMSCIIQGCGGGGSVRRRNTLHVVGGRQL
jgi:hypothetical protein